MTRNRPRLDPNLDPRAAKASLIGSSMVLVPTYAFDVVPRVGLMATIALVHLHICAARIAGSVRLPGNRLVNHFKVHHVVAWRSLMTLRATRRARRRVKEAGDCPLGRAVALRALLPEKLEVRVFV